MSMKILEEIERIKEKYSYYEIYEIVLRRMYAIVPCVVSNIVNKLQFKIRNVEYGRGFASRGIIVVENGARLPFTGTHNIKIANNVTINSSLKADAIGGECKTILRTITTKGKIIIGEHSGISNSAIIAQSLIQIGNYVKIGAGCKLYDTDFHSIDWNVRCSDNLMGITKPICIEDNVFIGAHSIILKGVTIGKGAVIGAGSVVTKSIPNNEVWAGNPARFIKKIN